MDKLDGPPTLASHTVRERQEYPQWIKVHSSQKMATVGSVPYKSGEPGGTVTAVQNGIKESDTS